MPHFPPVSISIWRMSCTVIMTLGNIWYYVVVVFGVHKTTHRVDDSLEELPRIGKSIILTITIYYNKWYRLKSTKETGTWDGVQKKLSTRSQVSCPKGVTWMHLISQQSCVTTCEQCQPMKLTWAMVSTVFLGVSHIRQAFLGSVQFEQPRPGVNSFLHSSL